MNLESIIAFHQITKDMDENETISLAQNLNLDYTEYKQRILGKEKEADFVVIIKSLGILKHIEAYDELVSHLTDEKTPDLKVELNDGYKMLIEVKHTDEDRYKISLGNLQKKIDYAKRQDIPLRFAVSLKGTWGLFQSETLEKNNGKLTIDDFRGANSKSCFDIELGTCSFIFNSQIKIKSVYSIDHPKGMEISYEPYGKLISYEFYSNDKRLFRVKGEGSPWLAYIIFLEALQDKVRSMHQDIEQNGNFTVITEYSDKGDNLIIPEYLFLLAHIKHLTQEINSKKIRYDSMSALQDQAFNFMPVEALRAIISKLVDDGVDITVLRDDETYKFNDFANIFWYKQRIKN